MNELTDEQIENIYLDHRDQLPNIPLIRAIITADRAQRQADLSAWQNSPTIDNADAIRAQRQAVWEVCHSQTPESAPQTSLSRTDATQAVERAHGISGVPARQLAVECDECGATHRPGENTLCPTFRPQQIAAPAAATGWKWVPLEPTAEMLQAGQDTPVSESDEDAPEDYKAVYRAMLAAAPHPQQIAGLDKDAEIERLKDALTFVERWANHHAQKPHVTAAEALSCIQHYPEIEAITESYADGKVPETRDPYAEIAALQQEVDNALALWTVAHAERSEAMSHGARLEAEIAALKAERDALLKNDARYRFVVGSTDHSVAKWHDCEGWYAIDEFDVDADMREQAVKS